MFTSFRGAALQKSLGNVAPKFRSKKKAALRHIKLKMESCYSKKAICLVNHQGGLLDCWGRIPKTKPWRMDCWNGMIHMVTVKALRVLPNWLRWLSQSCQTLICNGVPMGHHRRKHCQIQRGAGRQTGNSFRWLEWLQALQLNSAQSYSVLKNYLLESVFRQN